MVEREPRFDGHDSDAALVARVLDGETEQFGHLVRRYQAALYRHAVSIVLDHDVAIDMVQDVFVRAYANLHACRDPQRFRAWISQMVRNRCFDHLKEACQRNVRLDDIDPIVDTADGPMALVERTRLRSRIAEALATLPEAQREAFVMHYVEGVPYDTMAELLEASVSALKMRVLRAREALVACLQEHDVTPQPIARLTGRNR